MYQRIEYLEKIGIVLAVRDTSLKHSGMIKLRTIKRVTYTRFVGSWNLRIRIIGQ